MPVDKLALVMLKIVDVFFFSSFLNPTFAAPSRAACCPGVVELTRTEARLQTQDQLQLGLGLGKQNKKNVIFSLDLCWGQCNASCHVHIHVFDFTIKNGNVKNWSVEKTCPKDKNKQINKTLRRRRKH